MVIKLKRMRWMGHGAQVEEMAHAHRIAVSKIESK
jgi:hypothetical protein